MGGESPLYVALAEAVNNLDRQSNGVSPAARRQSSRQETIIRRAWRNSLPPSHAGHVDALESRPAQIHIIRLGSPGERQQEVELRQIVEQSDGGSYTSRRKRLAELAKRVDEAATTRTRRGAERRRHRLDGGDGAGLARKPSFPWRRFGIKVVSGVVTYYKELPCRRCQGRAVERQDRAAW